MESVTPVLRPSDWLRGAAHNIDWRDAGGGLVGAVSVPGYSIETAGRQLLQQHTFNGQLHVVARPAAAATGAAARRLFQPPGHHSRPRWFDSCPSRRDLLLGLELGSPVGYVSGWLATTETFLQLDGHMHRLLGDRPLYFPASSRSLLVFPEGVDISRGYAWAARMWKRADNPVSPLCFTRVGDKLTVYSPAPDRRDYAMHAQALTLATGIGRGAYHPPLTAVAH